MFFINVLTDFLSRTLKIANEEQKEVERAQQGMESFIKRTLKTTDVARKEIEKAQQKACCSKN